MDELIAAFEEAYGKVYARSARSPELGYLITHAIVTGSVPVETPSCPTRSRPRARPGEGQALGALGRRLRRDRDSRALGGPCRRDRGAGDRRVGGDDAGDPPGAACGWTVTRYST